MGTFVPSKYQKTVYIYIQKGKGNAVIDAVAGSGKSTTIVNALKLIPADKRVLFLAFNKSIVQELKIKIGNMSNVDVKTLHGLGAGIVKRSLNSELSEDKYIAWVNNGIKYSLLSPKSDLLPEEVSEWKHNIITLIDLGRVNLVKNFQELDNLAYKHNIDIQDNEIDIALKGIKWGERESQIMDYTDMIFFPNVKKLKMPQYDWVFVDECQDLNACQRNLFLKCLKPNGRFIAVGDPRQAIYGFAGADVESFNLLKSLPHTAKLPLSVCYRCDSEIINLAKTIVPQIEAKEGAAAGEVKRQDCVLADVKDGDMILCRISSPLVKLCMQYIGRGIKAYVKGKDIGKNLINMIKKTNRKQINDAMERFQKELSKIIGKVVAKQQCTEREAMESDMYKTYEDKVKAIEILSEGLTTCQEVMDRIELIFSDDNKNGICLSTIHKSKGLESDRVFIICEDKLYLKQCMQVPWMAEQEKNLVYVAYTRAKHFLGFIQDFSA